MHNVTSIPQVPQVEGDESECLIAIIVCRGYMAEGSDGLRKMNILSTPEGISSLHATTHQRQTCLGWEERTRVNGSGRESA